MILLIFSATLFLVTGEGRLAKSTDNGQNWTWLPDPLPFSNIADITSDKNGYLYTITNQGEIRYSQDQGTTWLNIINIPTSDAIALWVDGADIKYALTSSGDLWSSSGGWSIKTNLGLSDFVDLFASPDSGLYAVTKQGDVVKILNNTGTIKGNCGFSNIIAGATFKNYFYLLTEQGDILRSDNGNTFNWVGILSQIGMKSIVGVGNSNLFVTSIFGEVAKSPDGINWTGTGNANQIGVKGITTDSLSVLGVLEISLSTEISEKGILLKIINYNKKWEIFKAENKPDFVYLTTVSNSYQYLDKNVKGGEKYGYKVKISINNKEKWLGPLWITFPEKFKERILSLFPTKNGQIKIILYVRNPGIKKISLINNYGKKITTLQKFIPQGKYSLTINPNTPSQTLFLEFNKNIKKTFIVK